MGGFGDWLSSVLPDAPTGGWGSILGPAITAAGTYAAVKGAPQPVQSYGDTEAGFNATMALKQQDLAQALEIARIQAGAAGAGSKALAGAQVAAARIAQATALKDLKERALNDALSGKLNFYGKQGQLGQAAADSAAGAMSNEGALGQKGYDTAADIISRYKM